ncbi:HDIG domain-containing protein [Sporobacter termitidis DSM 10068]|uniref:HDIG domain-containing protein n=1 Tax=Sporobacter termitidis DSM 10068 TaxID=1123282 RepID=A0A1M5Y2Y1_9FIRM|nr:HD domain-containing phosphohydrolase [Sporobacter termitidis]SHI05853.1 HDIG domain-containing protein [Sporobacter termitidis DSM 10068]
MIENLNKINGLDIKESALDKEDGSTPKLLEISRELQANLKISGSSPLDSVLQAITNILCDASQNEPWWDHVYTLRHYIDWLYIHSINVSIISLMIAEALDLKPQLDDIALGAILHDIGKLAIPKKIVQKPGKLNEEEQFYMRHHCELGLSMTTGCGLSGISVDIIEQHHERLDGSGYPRGLTDAQIPLHARIVLMADVIDAMTSYRPYKKPKQIEDVVGELRREKSKYPQDILEVFRSLLL